MYIQVLPFAAPLDVDSGILALLQLEAAAIFVVSALAVWFVRDQISKFEKEAAAQAIGVVGKEVAQSVGARLAACPAEHWLKLFFCIIIDITGDLSYLTGPGSDFVFAPLEAAALKLLFGGNILALLGFLEEIVPFPLDIVPTATAAWVLQTLAPDSPATRFLGIQPPLWVSRDGASDDANKGASDDAKRAPSNDGKKGS